MKTVKILLKRFKAETPAILKKTRNACLAVSAFCASLTGTLIASGKYEKLSTILMIIGGVTTALAAGIAVGLQLSTSDTGVQQLN